MLEIEYELIRQEGNGHERIFHTDDKLKKIEGNATYIKAPNARGKSTLLNILALSLYGDRLDESDSRISESLRSDIEYLSSRKNQICTFNVKFTSKDGKIELISTKKNAISNDIEVKEIINGKERYLPFHKFREEYFLVYDIPEDPLNRIPEILSEVKNQQYRYHKKIQDFIRYLGEIKSEIANSRDEDEIIRTKTSISEYEDKKLNFKRSIDEIREQIRILESFLALREFERYVEFSFSLNESIENKGKIKSNRKKTAKTFNTRYENKRKHIKGKIDKIKMNISDLTYNLNNLFFKRDSREIEPHVEYLKILTWRAL
ncbi:MAG: AAA family ATPase [Treponema sp.]|nr:AAA family ATPase [Treponema sp.]